MNTVDLLASLLREDAARGFEPGAWDAVAAGEFCQAAEYHAVLPLVADRLERPDSGCPEAIRALVRERAMQHAARDLERELELRASVALLAAAHVQPVVFKGAQLAYTAYARPDLRPRLDTDVLIAPEPAARQAAHDALIAAGYTTTPHSGGDFVMTQRAYAKRRDGRVVHAIDVHWRISNPQVFSRLLDHDEALAASVPIPGLGPSARGLSAVHALLVACVHRVAHHADDDLLIWLVDIDRLARALRPEEWIRFENLMTERRMIAVCRTSLQRAAAHFATRLPPAFTGASNAPDPGEIERSATYLTKRRGAVAGALTDIRAGTSWRDRARIAREHLLPPADYMRQSYAPGSRAPLAWLYVRRALVGARRWLTSRT